MPDTANDQALVHTRNQVLFWAAAFAFVLLFIWMFKGILLPFVLGATIAYLLDPAVKAMRRRNIPRWAASALILGSFALFIALLLVLVTPLIYKEAVQLINVLPDYLDRTTRAIQRSSRWLQQHLKHSGLQTDIEGAIQDNLSTAVAAGGNLVTSLATGGKAVLDILYVTVLTPIIAFLMMNDWPRMKRWLDEMVPRNSHEIVGDLWHSIDAKISGFVRGQLIVAFLLGLMYAVSLTLAGLNFGFLIGAMIGVLSLIPLLGSTAGLVTSLAIAWFQTNSLPYIALIALIFFTGQFVEGNILTPRLLGRSVGMHPIWIIFSLTAGGALFGIVGMLVAVPVAATIGVLASYAIRQYKQSAFYEASSKPPEKTAVP